MKGKNGDIDVERENWSKLNISSLRYFIFSIFAIVILVIIIVLSSRALAATLTCSIRANSACTGTTLLYLQNDTGGFSNAHAQNITNISFPRYDNSLCCSSSSSITITTSCEEANFLRLSNETNAHVQTANHSASASNYSVSACFSATGGSVTCNYQRNPDSSSCISADYVCLASFASSDSSANNETNAHIGPCDEYETKVCCKITDDVVRRDEDESRKTAAPPITAFPEEEKPPVAAPPEEEKPPFVTPDISEEGFSISAVTGEYITREIKIVNTKNEPITIEIQIKTIGNIVKTLDKIILQPGEERNLQVNIDAGDKGLLTGKIILSTEGYNYELPVVLNVKSVNFLFDAAITLPERYKKIRAGDKIAAQVNLQQVGTKQTVDVNAEYVIKDFEGNSYLGESETFAVLEDKSYTKEFLSEGLPAGRYIVGMEISYPGAFATSSSQFEIIEEEEPALIYIIIVLAIIMGAGIILWAVKRKPKIR